MMRFAAAACMGIAVGVMGCTGSPLWTPTPPVTDPPKNDIPDRNRPQRDPEPERPAPASRLARLTPLQWENAVRDILQLEERTGFSAELPQDALPGEFLFDNPSDSLGVDPTQWAGFQRAAARAAELVTSDAALLARIVPPEDGDDAARARAFVEDIGGKAHRRPLEEAAVEAYLTVFEAGRVGFFGVEPFAGGVRLVLEAMLQSPFFLYRVELSDQVVDGAAGETIPLDPFEIASRLSFALWGSIPDTQLFEAALAGALDADGVAAHAQRMLEDPKATATLLHFHNQLLEAKKLAGVSPSAAFFPNAPADLGALARRENELFLEDAFTSGGGLTDLLTSTKTFVNADLARIYGIAGDIPAQDFVPVTLDPALRRGIFTHVAFLAQNATSSEPDAIHRGVFLAKNMACIEVSAPPADIPPLPPPQDFQTNRDRVVAHTEAGSPCMDCHKEIINPYGFPYEGYDAVGAVRTHDNGLPVNTVAEPILDDFTVVRDGVDLAEKMAESRVIHECYAQHWMEFALGRAHVANDRPLIERIGQTSLDGANIKDLLVALVTSPAFLERAKTEIGGEP
jgi:hypothetical protein